MSPYSGQRSWLSGDRAPCCWLSPTPNLGVGYGRPQGLSLSRGDGLLQGGQEAGVPHQSLAHLV